MNTKIIGLINLISIVLIVCLLSIATFVIYEIKENQKTDIKLSESRNESMTQLVNFISTIEYASEN